MQNLILQNKQDTQFVNTVVQILTNDKNSLKESLPKIKVTSFTPGKIVDMGIKDANNMGAAMAGAAKDTLLTHLKDLNRKPSYYDGIFTGDLGYIGKDILTDLCLSEGYNIKNNYRKEIHNE